MTNERGLESTPISTPQKWVRGFLRLLVLSLIVDGIVFSINLSQGRTDTFTRLSAGFFEGLLFAMCIGGLVWFAVERVACMVWDRHPVVRWAAMFPVMIAAGFAGTAAATAIIYFGFGLDNDVSYGTLLVAANRSTIPITLIVGPIVTVFEQRRSRLRATELALRTQQLERERAEKLAAEAQFASLTSRVQPHFLFNTLNSISALIRENPAQAEHMIERLASLLRSSLDPAKTVSIAQELMLVSDYLEIQQVRFGDRLHYRVEHVSDGLAGALVPPFAVQTLVENAVKHVAGQRSEGTDVRVTANRSDSCVVIDVTDNGPGFGPEAMKAGHGLDNLQQRLLSLFGEAASLELLPASGAMTVRMRVPA